MLFMPGMPGGAEVAVILLVQMIAALFAYPIYLHAKKRGNDHALAWGAGAFFAAIVGNFGGVIIVGILYYVVGVEGS